MTYSLALKNGDLAVSSSMVQRVKGTDKLKQDLYSWLVEAFRIDRFHPNYGSMLPSYIGTNATRDALFEIEVEVYRVLSNFQRYQKTLYDNNQDRFSLSEILDTVIEVNVDQRVDSLYVEVVFVTAESREKEHLRVEVR